MQIGVESVEPTFQIYDEENVKINTEEKTISLNW